MRVVQSNRWAPLGVAVAAVAALMALSSRYGYHRDEFYYLAAGLRPAFGYVDQPPLTPLIARAAFELLGESPSALRLAPALAIGLTVLLTAAIAGELGGCAAARTLASATVAVASFPMATGHVLSTSTFDLLAWTALSWLLLRALRDGGPVWLAVGTVAGLALENKTLVVGFLGAVGAAMLFTGPRSVLRDRWFWLAVLVAAALWAPNLVWQASHGWPQLALADQIARVGNGGSEPRWLFPIFQLLLVSPFLVPVWVAGLWSLARDPERRSARAFAVGYLILFGALLVAGGKPYYLVGLYPVLLAAGAAPTLRWVREHRWRSWLLGAGLVVSAAATALLVLPVVPARSLPNTAIGGVITAVQPISGDSIGWPELVDAVQAAYRTVPAQRHPNTVVLTRNYGQAGAVELFGRRTDLPPAYSGHNSYADWGPPPESTTDVVAVGFDEATLRGWFADVRPAGRVDNGIGLDNPEQGTPVWVCASPRQSWAALWPNLRRIS